MDEGRMHNDDSREKRIQMRRERIAARLAAKREGEEGGGKAEDDEEKEVGKGKQQIGDSRKRLNKIKKLGDDQVTSIRVVTDDRENRRRIDEEERRQELRAKLLAEAEHSARRNATVAMRWADLFSVEVPQELYEEIEKQRHACKKITDSKKQLIDEIKDELKAKDDEHVKTLKRFGEDIDLLLQHMGNQFRALQAANVEELAEIERAFDQERAELLAANNEELNQLFDQRATMEQNFLDQTQEQSEKYQQMLEDLRVHDAEQFNILKTDLETDVANLEQSLEDMRALYQLNTEKLDYNYKVLLERNKENETTIAQQKRKISRQRDILSNLKSKYHESDKRYQDENTKLTEEYKRITEQFKDLQSKYRHFETADTRRFKEVWEMNESLVAGLVRKLMEADKIIHEQQLGLTWHAPDEEVFISPMSAEARDEEASTAAEGEEPEMKLQERLADPAYAKVVELLCDGAGFLVENKVRKVCEGVPRAQADLMRVSSVLFALGVTDPAGFESLVQALSAVKAGELQEGEDPLSALISPDQLVERLRVFVSMQDSAASGKPVRLAPSMDAQKSKDKEYWERMSNIINDKMFRVWGNLEKALLNYNGLLSERQELLKTTTELQKQNDELRALLNQYLSSKINEELVIAPTAVI